MVFRFAVFELDQLTGELTRQGRRVALAPQPAKVLALLAARAGRIVTRDELRQLLWGSDTHVEFDRSLNFCIASARRALGDTGRQSRFIETLPRRGYRFIVEVRISETETADERVAVPAATDVVAPPPRRFVRRWVWSRVGWAAIALPLLVGQAPVVLSAHSRETALPQSLAAFYRGWAQRDRDAKLRQFEDAVRLDPRFAEAHFAVAEAYLDLAWRRERPQRQALMLAREAAQRALEFEEAPESRRVLAMTRLALDWDWPGALGEFEQLIGSSPASDGVLSAYADLRSASGDDTAALALMARAEAVSGGCDLLLYASAVLQYRAGRYEVALAKLEAARAAGPARDRPEKDWITQLADLAMFAHVQLGDWRSAQEDALTILRAIHVPDGDVREFAAREPRAAVTTFFVESAARSRPGAITGARSGVRLARISALLGHDDEALAWLERARADRDPELLFVLRNPEFQRIRLTPRFRSVLQAVGL